MNLDELRLEINQIDDEMLKLFEKRMHVAKKIGMYKKDHGLPVLDQKREDALLNMMKSKVEDESLESFYEAFLIEVMRISKDYQNEI